MKHPVCFTRV